MLSTQSRPMQSRSIQARRFAAALSTVFCLLAFTLALPAAPAAEAAELSEHLAPFAPYLGKTWRGELSEPGSEEVKIDISRMESALNGQAVRSLHSVNDGEYGGEAFYVWDREKETIVYYYFTTAGFYTHGELSFEDGKFVAVEEVTGNQNGITQVKSVGEILEDGRLKSSSQYFKDGEWTPGHTAYYTEAPGAEIKFK